MEESICGLIRAGFLWVITSENRNNLTNLMKVFLAKFTKVCPQFK
jgi:hypothetical protein